MISMSIRNWSNTSAFSPVEAYLFYKVFFYSIDLQIQLQQNSNQSYFRWVFCFAIVFLTWIVAKMLLWLWTSFAQNNVSDIKGPFAALRIIYESNSIFNNIVKFAADLQKPFSYMWYLPDHPGDSRKWAIKFF